MCFINDTINYGKKRTGLFLAVIFIFLFLFDLSAARAEYYRYKDEGALTIWYNDLKGSLELNNPAFDLNTNFKDNGNFKTQVNPGFSWRYNKNEKMSFFVSSMNTEQKGRFSAYSLKGAGVFVNGTKFGTNAVELIDEKLDFNRVNLLMSYELLGNDENGHLNLIAGCELFKLGMNFSAAATNAVSVYSRKAFMPLAGISGDFKMSEILRFHGSYNGMQYNFNEGDSKRKTTIHNTEFGIEYHILPPKDNYIVLSQNSTHIVPNDKIEWFIDLGYKEDYFKESYKNNKIILRHFGPYLNIAGRF